MSRREFAAAHADRHHQRKPIDDRCPHDAFQRHSFSGPNGREPDTAREEGRPTAVLSQRPDRFRQPLLAPPPGGRPLWRAELTIRPGEQKGGSARACGGLILDRGSRARDNLQDTCSEVREPSPTIDTIRPTAERTAPPCVHCSAVLSPVLPRSPSDFSDKQPNAPVNRTNN